MTRSRAAISAAKKSRSTSGFAWTERWSGTPPSARASSTSAATSPCWRLTNWTPGIRRTSLQSVSGMERRDRLAGSTPPRQDKPTFNPVPNVSSRRRHSATCDASATRKDRRRTGRLPAPADSRRGGRTPARGFPRERRCRSSSARLPCPCEEVRTEGKERWKRGASRRSAMERDVRGLRGKFRHTGREHDLVAHALGAVDHDAPVHKRRARGAWIGKFELNHASQPGGPPLAKVSGEEEHPRDAVPGSLVLGVNAERRSQVLQRQIEEAQFVERHPQFGVALGIIRHARKVAMQLSHGLLWPIQGPLGHCKPQVGRRESCVELQRLSIGRRRRLVVAARTMNVAQAMAKIG